jgi:hypothetical protein
MMTSFRRMKSGLKLGETREEELPNSEPLTPSAVYDTCVFSCFEAGDSVTNLHVSLDRYKDDIKELQGMMWKYMLYFMDD